MSNGAEPRGWKEPLHSGTAVGVSVVVLALVGFYVNVRAKDTTTTVTVSSTPDGG